MEYKIQRWYS